MAVAVAEVPRTGTGAGTGTGRHRRRPTEDTATSRPVGVAVGPGPSVVPVASPEPVGVSVAAGVTLVSPLRPEAWPADAGPFGELPARPAAVTSTPPVGSAAQPVAAAAPMPRIVPAEPIPTYAEPAGAEIAAPDRDIEPSLPDEERSRAQDAADAPTPPTDASASGVLHVRFSTAAGQDRLVSAMETFKAVIRDRPGPTRVVIHVPSGGGAPLPMELRRGVAYDADLLAEVGRRLGSGLVELQLA